MTQGSTATRPIAASVWLGLLAVACTRHPAPERASERRDAHAIGVSSSDASDLLADSRDATVSDATTSDARNAGDSGTIQPLSGFAELSELFDPDGHERLGFVSVPLGASEPRPLMIAIHGGSERPETACAAWRGVVEAHAFVVCPRGFGGKESALGWRTTADTAQRIARASAATRKTFGSWVRETSTVVLVGFSMGGSQVALLARAAPGTYRRIVVGDSAHDPQPALTFSRAWVEGGGERAAFLCSTSGCEPSLRAAARNVATHGAPARLNIAPTQVHGLSELVVQSMRRDWAWVVEGAEGWQTYSPPADASLPGKTESFEPKRAP